ncbi:arginyl-tRNA--protein transferase 1 isoform X3 [Eurytemora carolleeae]|uniref:arginyl-tRNA--protein transferase 1 isoform X3 n=1 Tax=Eurytemora carolleeae TaxID=1294199 RepID=UPI000C765B4A|nr:arginyl-tRNA--protein transferase 1 isoform X3 [Eurytemora carolleeae]|eukprot:XP_023347558.1 arginyl-tRNA--protein transferase 1-like isoform X3 [Eurytemora affinis]
MFLLFFRRMESLSIVSYIPDSESSSCGYCKEKGSISSGMWAHYLSAENYQALLDRGWRRSGRFVYKPVIPDTCCPLYTIRCNAKQFIPTKSQKKVAKKVNNFLLRGKGCTESPPIPDSTKKGLKRKDKEDDFMNKNKDGGIKEDGELNAVKEELKMLGMKKAKVRRMERSLKKEKECMSEKKDGLKTFSGSLEQLTAGSTSTTGEETYKHQLSLRLVKADQSDAEFKDKESDCSEETFKSFLCDSPLPYSSSKSSPTWGSYHQHYLLDGKIIAVGVVDILPGCVSSVYFYYNPEYSFLSLGTYSALREIEFTVSLGLEFYYMGYYVHTCPKMRYKGSYKPSQLLSLSSYNWHPIEKCTAILETTKYSCFEDETPGGAKFKPSLRKVKLFFQGSIISYREGLLKSLPTPEQNKLTEFIDRVQDLAEFIIPVITDSASASDSDSDSEL